MKKKILFIMHSLGWDGAAKSLISLLKYLNYSKYEVDLLLICKTGAYLNQLPREVRLYHLGNGNEFLCKLSLVRFLQKVWRRLRYEFFNYFPYFLYKYKLENEKYDLEINFVENLPLYILKSPSKSKKLVWIHNDLRAEYLNSTRKKMLSSLGKIDRIVTVSNQSKNVIVSMKNGLEDKIQVIYNVIDINRVLKKAREKLIEKKARELSLIALGRLVYQKGFDRLLNVCERLVKKDNLNFKLSILGDGPDRDKLIKQIKRLDLSDHVELIGYQSNPYPYIKAADIFVSSSRYEAMPYVVLEALILNKPIVSTDVTGPGELLKEGEWGLLVENSEEGLYKGLKKMITDKEFRESFTKKEKDFSPFDPEYIAEEVENMIDQLCRN